MVSDTPFCGSKSMLKSPVITTSLLFLEIYDVFFDLRLKKR